MKKYIGIILCLLVMSSEAGAVNRLGVTPTYIDTPGSGDVTISPRRIYVQNITVTAYTTDKTVTFIDADGNTVLLLECPADESIAWPPIPCTSKGCEFPNGLYLDDSATELANSSDFVFIWFTR